jgi:hypothetical protein
MKKNKTLEEQQRIAVLKGIIEGYGINNIPTIMPQDRAKRRLVVKYIILPIYWIVFPSFTIYMFITKHYIIGSFGLLFTAYGIAKSFMGDRLILWLMNPFLKRILK